MSFPAQITDGDYSVARREYPCQNLMHVHNGRIYVVNLYEPTSSSAAVTVHRSMDGGETWTECDAGNRKSISKPGYYFSYGVCRDGDDLIVAHSQSLTIDRFSMASNTWQARVASGGPATEDCRTQTLNHPAGRCFPVKRSDGSIVVLYQAPPVSPPQYSFYFMPRAKYAIWTGSAWLGPYVVLADTLSTGIWTDEGAIGAVLGKNNRVHFFVESYDGAQPPEADLHHAALESNNTLGRVRSITNNWDVTEFQETRVGAPAYSATEDLLMLPYLGERYGERRLIVATAPSVADPVWTSETPPYTLYTTTRPNYYPSIDGTGSYMVAIASDTQTGLVWRIGGADDGTVVYSGRVNGTWSDPMEIYQPYGLESLYAVPTDDYTVGVYVSLRASDGTPSGQYLEFPSVQPPEGVVRFIPPGSSHPTPSRIGPFKYGNALYGHFTNIAYYDGLPGRPSMYKSTDGGRTWNIVDPQTDLVGGWSGLRLSSDHGRLGCDRYGDVFYLAWHENVDLPTGSTRLRIAKFDFATERWTSDISGAGPEIPGTPAAYSSTGDYANRPLTVLCARKSDGLLHIGYTSSPGVVSSITFDPASGAWGEPVTLAAGSRKYYATVAVSTGEKIHWFICSSTDSFPVNNTEVHLHHVTLDGETVCDFQTLSTDIGDAWYGNVGQPDIGYGEIAITALSRTLVNGVSQHYLFTAPEANNPTWTTEILPKPGGDRYMDSTLNPLDAFGTGAVYTSGTESTGVFFFSQNYSGTSWRGSRNDYREYFMEFPPSEERLNVMVSTYDEPGTHPPDFVRSKLWRLEKMGPGVWNTTMLYQEENDYILGAPNAATYAGQTPVGRIGNIAY
jgi:hypothetical protein